MFIWLTALLVFLLAMWVFGSSRVVGRQFRFLCSALAVVGLVATYCNLVPMYYLLWYTPLAIVGTFLFVHRKLLALGRRLDRLEFTDTDDLQRQVKREVQRYNDSVDEPQQLQ